ncbi:Na/Pi-cotransporter II-related protein [Kingella potus]|uniref:Na/Pi-cotransporter II-related protein n=1 Tax=Kingella potus TaxID=265175 RepID=A0A377R2F9_9NEIS|nr:Na/Pi symporter [Kingella potus]STR02666.1 Na/Pi-cotransporter II-related protein [Kingella potus]
MAKLVQKYFLFAALLLALAASFAYSPPWLRLCYGLALFLFGMQNIEEGLRNAAGGRLERWMRTSTSTPLKGVLFGTGATLVLQSSTLVALLAMAFLSSGMISLAGGIAIILGTNLGATGGVWLLAAAGQNISLSPAALPMMVFGILMGFFGERNRAFGRVLVGVALIFLGVDEIKNGFHAFGAGIDFSGTQIGGMGEVLLFFAVGFLLTVVLQSSHATLLLALAALSGGQLTLMQGFAVAVGSCVGTSVSTALVGMLGSERGGQRLAVAHVLFNVVTAALSLAAWWPLTHFAAAFGQWLGLNELMQLALFHTLFNLLGIAVFWKLQNRLAAELCRRLPDKAAEAQTAASPQYLNANMLLSAETALMALSREIRHLDKAGTEVMCHALFVPPQLLYDAAADSRNLPAPVPPLDLDVPQLYERQIKPLFSAILDFTGRLDLSDNPHQEQLTRDHTAAWRIVETVKESQHLQKNMQQYLQDKNSPAAADYLRLRRHVFQTLLLFRRTDELPAGGERSALLEKLYAHTDTLETFRARVMVKLRNKELNGWQASSLLNDINYARRIGLGVAEILQSRTPENTEAEEGAAA